jgi:membrane-bound lytic murein transglycosylase D
MPANVEPEKLRTGIALLPEDERHLSERFSVSAGPVGDLWDRIRSGFGLSSWVDGKQAKRQRSWAGLHQAYMDQIVDRARPYLHHIVEEVERREMPAELALLPIIESAFEPEALSPQQAAGIWQLIPSTGRRFGLKQNPWYDGRRDVIASTTAALNYLLDLKTRFNGNWLHAIAAYNCGEGLVESAIDKNKALGRATDFWSLDLPEETRNFVPKLLAVSKVVANPAEYNVNLKPIPDRLYATTVNVNGQVGLDKLAKLANLSVGELRGLNPGYIGSTTAPNDAQKVFMPVDNIKELQQRLAVLPPRQKELALIEPPDDAELLSATSRVHKLARYESLLDIARSNAITLRQLREANNLSESSVLKAGQKLLIPGPYIREQASTSDKSALHRSGAARYVRYMIREGDSIWRIAQRFRVTVEQICHWNALPRGNPGLLPGDVLHIYANNASPA